MAHIDDKITKVAGKAFAALEAPGKSPGDTSIRLSRAFPEGLTVIFFMREVNPSTGEVVPDTETVWRGIPVGNTLTQLKLVRGADRRYEPGQATQVYIPINAHWANDLIDALLVHHDTNGNLKPNTVTYDHIDEKTEYKFIASPSDLNDAQFLVPGKWRFGNNQQVGSTKNLPLANNTGVMETISHSGGTTRPGAHAWSYILQIFTALDGRMFIRNISTAESAGNIKFGAWQEFAKEKAFAAARSDVTYYQNSGTNKVRTKDKIAERGNITIDTANNEFVIGEGVGLVQIAATVMTESITSAYLYLIVIHKPLDKPEKEIRQVLTEKVSSYCGASITATIKVQPGDRVYVKHDCTARIRGHTSEVSVREI